MDFIINAFICGVALAAFLSPITISAILIDRWLKK